MRIGLILLVLGLLWGCSSSMNNHEQNLRNELMRVKYEDGISLLEAKSIAEVYLYLHAGKIGKAPHVQVRDAGEVWLCDIFGGRAISPERVDSPPVVVDKRTGEVSWPDGPTVDRVVLPEGGARSVAL